MSFQSLPACRALSGCFQCLAAEYPHVKFCVVDPTEVDLSQNLVSIPNILIDIIVERVRVSVIVRCVAVLLYGLLMDELLNVAVVFV